MIREAVAYLSSALAHLALLNFVSGSLSHGPRPLPIDEGRVSIELMAAIESKYKPSEEADAEEIDKTPTRSESAESELTPSVGKRRLAMLDAPQQASTRIDAAAPQPDKPLTSPKRSAEKPRLEVVQKIPRQPPEPLELPTEQLVEASAASTPSQAHQGVEREEPPKKLPTNPKPTYPPEALRAGWQGRVVLRVTVSEVGLVRAVSVETSSGFPALDEAAVTAMRSWRFEPAARAGRAVAHEGLHAIRFRLEDR